MVEVRCPDCGTIKEINGTEERVRCASKDCGKRFYTKDNIIVPEKRTEKDNNGTPQKTTILHRPSKVSIPIDNVNWLIVLEVMDRGISTIRNKPDIKKKKGSYYYDKLKWDVEFKKIEEIAKVMKLMGNANE